MTYHRGEVLSSPFSFVLTKQDDVDEAQLAVEEDELDSGTSVESVHKVLLKKGGLQLQWRLKKTLR